MSPALFVSDTSTAGGAVVVDESVNIVVDLMATWAYACGLSQLIIIIIIIIIHLLIKVYKIHKSNKTSKTEQDSKAHWALTAALKTIKTVLKN